MPEVEKLSVVLETELKGYTAGMKAAGKQAQGLASEIEKSGDKADKSAVKAEGAFSRVSRAIKEARNEAKNGADFKARADASALERVKGIFSSIRRDASDGASFRVNGDASGMQGVATAIQSARNDAQNGATFKVNGDASGLQGIATAIQGTRTDAQNGATFKVLGDVSGISGMASAIQGVRSEAENGATFRVQGDTSGLVGIGSEIQSVRIEASNGATFRVTGDTSGLGGIAMEIQAVRSEAGNGATFTVKGDTSGLLGVAAELQAVEGEVGRLDGRNINLDTSGAVSGVSSLRSELFSLSTLLALTGIPVAVGGIAALGSTAVMAASGVAGLGMALGAGLAGGAVAAAGAMSVLGGAFGLVGGPIAALVSKLTDYHSGLSGASSASASAASAANQYDSALSSLSQAQAAVGDAQVQANEKVASAVDAYESTLQAAEDQERSVKQARDELGDTTLDLLDKQNELNRALRDEPLNQEETYLNWRDAGLAVADATGRLVDEQEKLNQARATGDPKKIADAELAVMHAQNGVERSSINLKKAHNAYTDTATDGSRELVSAQKGVDDAYKQQSKAAQNVEDQERKLTRARADSDKAYQGIAKAQRDGAKQVADAQARVSEAEKAVAQAAQAMADAQSKAAEKTVALTAAQQALYDRFMQFKADAATAFEPAMDSAALLGVRILDLADNYFPALGVASLAAMDQLGVAFDEFAVGLQQPIPGTAIQTILDYIPEATYLAATAAGQLGIALVTALGLAAPYGMDLIRFLSVGIEKMYAFTQSAQGVSTLSDVFAGLVSGGRQVWGVLVDLGAGVYNLFSAISQASIPDQMLNGLSDMAQYFRDVTTAGSESRVKIDEFLSLTGPALSAIGSLAGELATQFFDMSYAVATAINPDTGNSTLLDLFSALEESAQIIGPWLSQTFIDLGPAVAAALPVLTEFLTTFAGSSDFLVSVIDDLSWMMGIFNDLPQPVKDAAVEVAALSAAFGLLGGPPLLQSGFYMSMIAVNAGRLLQMTGLASLIGGWASSLWAMAGGGWAALAPLAAIAAIGLIAIDIVVHWPDISAAFSSTYAQAREGGDGVASSFMQALSAGIDATTIGSTIFAAVDAATGWLNSQGLWDNVSIWDVFTGEATWDEAAASGNLIAKLSNVVDAGIEWVKGLFPETNLVDVIMGRQEDTGDNPLINTLTWIWDNTIGWIKGLFPETNLVDVLMGRQEDTGDNPLINAVTWMWDGATEWISGLVPDISLMDVLMGAVEYGGDLLSAVLTPLSVAWAGVMEWLAGLVPEISLLDVIMGGVTGLATWFETILAQTGVFLNVLWQDYFVYYWTAITTSVSEALSYLWSGVIVYYFTAMTTSISEAMNYLLSGVIVYYWTSITTSISDAMSYIWSGIIVYYWTSITTSISDALSYIWSGVVVYYWTSITTSISDAMSYIWNDVIVYYWTSITTSISDALSYIWNDVIVYYWTSITTSISDAMSYIWNDIIVYYWDSITTSVSDSMLYLWNDVIIYYWDSITTSISDAMSYIWNDVIVYYWDSITTSISDALSYIYNDYFLYYFGSDGVLAAAASDAWSGMLEGVDSFVGSLGAKLGDGIKDAVNDARWYLGKLLEAASSVLTAIGDPGGLAGGLGETAASLITPMAEGGVIGMANGGVISQGPTGGIANGHNPRVVYGEVGKKESYAVHGEMRSLPYAESYAQSVGHTLVPMALGGEWNPQNTKPTRLMPPFGYPAKEMARWPGEGLGAAHWDVQPYIAERANKIAGAVGGSWNTYYGHGNPGGATEDLTFDVWGPGGRGDPLGSSNIDTAASMGIAYPDIMYAIANGYMYRDGWFPFPEDPHYDHTHLSYGGTPGANGGRGAFDVAGYVKKLWEKYAPDVPDLGEGPLWTGVETWMGDMPGEVIDWLVEQAKKVLGKISGAAGRLGSFLGLGSGGDAASNMALGQEMASAMGWTGAEWEALKELWMRESGWDNYADNPSSTAYGIWQGLTETSSDPATQISHGLDYISGRYGSPSAALAFHDANGWYERGGIVPGSGPVPIMAHGGERILPVGLTQAFDKLAEVIMQWVRSSGGAQGVTGVSRSLASNTATQSGGTDEGYQRILQTMTVNGQAQTQEIVNGQVVQGEQTRTQMTSDTASIIQGQAVQSEQNASVVDQQTSELTASWVTELQGLGDRIRAEMQPMIENLQGLGERIRASVMESMSGMADKLSGMETGISNVSGVTTSLLDVTKYAWGLASGGLISGNVSSGVVSSPKWLVGEGSSDELVAPLDGSRRSKDLIAQGADRLGLTLLDGKGNPLNGGAHRLVDGAHAVAYANSGAGRTDGGLGWDSVSGRAMKVKSYSAYGGIVNDAMTAINALGGSLKVLPHFGNRQDVTVSDRYGDGWIGLATSGGDLFLDPTAMSSSYNTGLALTEHELLHHAGWDHANTQASVLYPSLMLGGGNPTLPNPYDSGRFSGVFGSGGSTPRINAFHEGGMVLGPQGAEGLARLKVGESVLSERATDRLANSIQLWSARGNGDFGTDREGASNDEVIAAITDLKEALVSATREPRDITEEAGRIIGKHAPRVGEEDIFVVQERRDRDSNVAGWLR